MTLALRMGRTLGELRQVMPASELLLWEEFDRQSPISDRRGDIQTAQVASAVLMSRGADVKMSDLILDWAPAQGEAADSTDDGLEAAFAGILPG